MQKSWSEYHASVAKPINVREHKFPSHAACARHFGISSASIAKAVALGTEDNIGLGKGNWRKKSAVKHDD